MAPTPPDVPHLDGRDAALRALGFPPYQAAWLTLVCLHSGVFIRRQFTEHHRCSTKTTHAFVHRLIDNGLAREKPLPGSAAGLRYTHVHGRGLYRALGIEHARRSRAVEEIVLFRRLLSLEYVLRQPALPWLATEAEKTTHFISLGFRRGFRRVPLPHRFYGPARRRSRRYFALDLPIAADDRSARFVYADPGRQTASELRRWADEHRAFWTHLRHTGVTVHVAVITRTVAAQNRYSRLLATWLNAPSAQPLTPEEWETMAAIKAAILAADPAGFDRWGGFNPARRILIDLRKRAERAAAGVPIDSYSTDHAPGLSPQCLTA